MRFLGSHMVGAVVVALLISGVASARVPASTSVRLTACQLADTALAREATFVADMHALPGSDRMALRFTLREALPGLRPTVVPSPALQQWRRSRPGVARLEYTQTVNGLDPGGIYTMRVEYRWLDAQGHLMRQQQQVSGACREWPILAVRGLTAAGGAESGTEIYRLVVANTASYPVRGASLRVFTAGGSSAVAAIDTLPGHAQTTVEVQGPACRRRVRTVISLTGTPERRVFVAPCPAVQG